MTSKIPFLINNTNTIKNIICPVDSRCVFLGDENSSNELVWQKIWRNFKACKDH